MDDKPMELPTGGFIKIYRKLKKHWLWNDPVKLKWWLDILFEANYEPKKVPIGNSLIECDRGQVVYSYKTWAKRWGVSESKVRRFLYMLQSDNMIVIENVRKTTRITVCNYNSYNDKRIDSESKVNPKRIDSESKVKTTKEGKEIQEGEEVPQPAGNRTRTGFVAPTEDEVVTYFKENGYRVDVAKKAFNYYKSLGWKDSNNKPVKNWKAKMNGVWFRDEHKSHETPRQQHLSIPEEDNKW